MASEPQTLSLQKSQKPDRLESRSSSLRRFNLHDGRQGRNTETLPNFSEHKLCIVSNYTSLGALEFHPA